MWKICCWVGHDRHDVQVRLIWKTTHHMLARNFTWMILQYAFSYALERFFPSEIWGTRLQSRRISRFTVKYSQKSPMFGFQWATLPGLGSRLCTYWPIKWSNKWWRSQHTSAGPTPVIYASTSGLWAWPPWVICSPAFNPKLERFYIFRGFMQSFSLRRFTSGRKI